MSLHVCIWFLRRRLLCVARRNKHLDLDLGWDLSFIIETEDIWIRLTSLIHHCFDVWHFLIHKRSLLVVSVVVRISFIFYKSLALHLDILLILVQAVIQFNLFEQLPLLSKQCFCLLHLYHSAFKRQVLISDWSSLIFKYFDLPLTCLSLQIISFHSGDTNSLLLSANLFVQLISKSLIG